MRLPFPAPMGGMNFSLPKIGLPLNFAHSIINGICRNGGVVSRGGLGVVTGTNSGAISNAEPKKWLHTFVLGDVKHLLSVTTGADVHKLYPSVSSVYAYTGTNTVTESNAIMFDGVLQYSLYPAAAPRTWDGYNDAALSFTRPVTGDWANPSEMVTNGDFASGASWTAGTGWAIGAGVATGTAATGTLTQTIAFAASRRYRVTYTVSGYVGGAVQVQLTGGTAVGGSSRTANGTYTEVIEAHSGGNTTLTFTQTAAFTGSIDNVSVTLDAAITDSDVTGFCAHKSRVWYWSRKSDEACYTALNARGGTLVRFPLGYVAQTGGNIILIETLTMDGGNGPDDFLAFVLDTGECLIYQGSDPGDPADWAIVGRFNVPPPLNGKCVTRIGGDSLMLTQAGLIPLQNYIKAAFGQTQVDWLEKINPRIRSIAPSDGRLFYSATNGLLLVQCNAYLFAMDVKTGGWSYWTLSAPLGDTWGNGDETLGISESGNFRAGGFAEINSTLYVLGYGGALQSPFFSDTLYQYNTGQTRDLAIVYGPQFVDQGAISTHVRPYLETSGTGEIAVYLGNNNDTPMLQFSVAYSGQTPFYSYSASGVGNTLQAACVVEITDSPATEGLVKYVAIDVMSESTKLP